MKENYTRSSVESPCFDRGDHIEKLGDILSIITYASVTGKTLVLFAYFVNDEAQFRPKKSK